MSSATDQRHEDRLGLQLDSLDEPERAEIARLLRDNLDWVSVLAQHAKGSRGLADPDAGLRQPT